MTRLHEIVDRQLRRWESERLAALESARQAGSHARLSASPTVTVARQAGVRGTAIARALASRLGYQLFDQEIIDYIASHHEVRRKLLEMLDEHTASGIRLWAEGIVRAASRPRRLLRSRRRCAPSTATERGDPGRGPTSSGGRPCLPDPARGADGGADRGAHGGPGSPWMLSPGAESSDAARSEFIRSFFHTEWGS
jgi:hypothetical protein